MPRPGAEWLGMSNVYGQHAKKPQIAVVIRHYIPNIFFRAGNGEVMQDGFFDRISGVQNYFFLTRKKRLIPAE